jgi:hypothetical protein
MKHYQISVLSVSLALVMLASVACGDKPSPPPTATVQAYFEAVKKRDLAAFKKTLAKETLKREEEIAKQPNKPSADEHFKAILPLIANRLADKLETRNEKIEGDKAAVEIKAKDGSWAKWELAKEDGEWKLLLRF